MWLLQACRMCEMKTLLTYLKLGLSNSQRTDLH
jgi:hypothetical protein